MNLHKSCRLNDFSANTAPIARFQRPSNLIASQKNPNFGSFCLTTDFPPLNLVRRESQPSSARVSRPRRSRRPVRPWTFDFRLSTLDFGLWTLDLGPWTLDFGPPINRFPRFPHFPP